MENLSAKNLRIGNTVLDVTGFLDLEPNDFVDKPLMRRITPIEITEDWLINFGFQKHHAWEYRWVTGGLQIIETNGYWYPAVFSNPEMSHEDDQCVSLNRIQYIHELQNLFFAITGEELELKTVV